MVRSVGGGLAAAVCAAVVTGVVWAQTDSVKGTVLVAGNKISLTSGMAVSYASANGQLISVVVSDKPADRKEFATDTTVGPGEPLVPGTIEGAWKSQHITKKLSGFTFSFDAKTNAIISDEFLVGGRNNTFSLGTDEYVLELESTSPRLVGRIRTKTPTVDAGSRNAGLDASFDLAVETRK